jgi:ligand-binding SRPBCC domain-containing protein
LPVRWRTRIIDWTPPHQFIDLQLRGPYTLWHHQHRFFASGAGSGFEAERARSGGTECSDRVIYKLPGGPIGSITHALVVRRQLIDIFQYRREAIGRLLGKVQVHQDVQVRRL